MIDRQKEISQRIDKILISLGVNPDSIKPMTSEEVNKRLDYLIDRLNIMEVV